MDDTNEDDMNIEDLFENKKKAPKKKVDGKAKGDRTELHLCKLLTDHFGEDFSRSVGSGSRWSQVKNMPEHAKQVYAGDICVPAKFKWVIESKGGYEKDMDAWNAIDGKLSQLDLFLEQVSRDADYTKRKPILCWKRNRKDWLACVKTSDMPLSVKHPCYLIYNNWMIMPLSELLKETDRDFWFEKEDK